MNLHPLSRIIVLYSPQVQARYNELSDWCAGLFRRCIENLKDDFSTPGWIRNPSQNRFSKFHASRFEPSLTETYFSKNVALSYRCIDNNIEVIDFYISNGPSPDNNSRELSYISDIRAVIQSVNHINTRDFLLFVLARDIVDRQYSDIFVENNVDKIHNIKVSMSIVDELSGLLLRDICNNVDGITIYAQLFNINRRIIKCALRQSIDLSGYLDFGCIIDMEIMFDRISAYSLADTNFLNLQNDIGDSLLKDYFSVDAAEAECCDYMRIRAEGDECGSGYMPVLPTTFHQNGYSPTCH